MKGVVFVSFSHYYISHTWMKIYSASGALKNISAWQVSMKTDFYAFLKVTLSVSLVILNELLVKKLSDLYRERFI